MTVNSSGMIKFMLNAIQAAMRGVTCPPAARQGTGEGLDIAALILANVGAKDAGIRSFPFRRHSMAARPVLSALALGLALAWLTSCGNTIRGVGRDLGNAVDATQDAGRSVVHSVK